MSQNESPYLSNSRRLADILAAIQVMGAYTFASRKYDAWVEKLGDPLSAKSWNFIFSEHPEFFSVSEEWVSLR